MHTCCFEITFTIYGAGSLKEKRMVIKSIIQRCQNKFNISIIESGYHDKWQICSIGIALAAVNKSTADQNSQKIIDFLYNDDRVQITKIDRY